MAHIMSTPPQAESRLDRAADANTALIDILNGLNDTCADGAYGFASCADYSNIGQHRTLFRQRAQQCDQAQVQLHELVLRLGGQPARGGSASGALHRGWVAVRGTLSGLRDQSIVAECERGETVTRERYQEALRHDLPPEVRHLLERHLRVVNANLKQIRLLREAARASA